jgi:ribosomal protein S18 acetylase RimI-like enzyme
MDISLRDASGADEDFLFALYASTRERELALLDWSEDERAAFLRMQFNAQRTHYLKSYPDARHQIILRGGEAAGRIWVERNDEEIRLLDIALLPAHRGHGVGSALIRGLIREATQAAKPLRHSVEKNNPDAKRLYDRLGFKVVGEIPTHYFLEHQTTEGQGGGGEEGEKG